MDIYVGNVPKGTRPGEIKKLIKKAIKNKVFPRLFEKIVATGRIDKGVGVKIHKNKTTNGEYNYGHIVVHSSGIGRLTIDSLVNAELRGCCLIAREFVIRDKNNDRRAPNWRELSWSEPCRRQKERRKNPH
jgi:RNA recognition motif-containing protein